MFAHFALEKISVIFNFLDHFLLLWCVWICLHCRLNVKWQRFFLPQRFVALVAANVVSDTYLGGKKVWGRHLCSVSRTEIGAKEEFFGSGISDWNGQQSWLSVPEQWRWYLEREREKNRVSARIRIPRRFLFHLWRSNEAVKQKVLSGQSSRSSHVR